MIETTHPNAQVIPIAVVSRPGIMQQSLNASLASYPWIVVTASFGDGLSALNHLAQFRPAILVIDSNLLEEEVDALLAAVKARHPGIRCLALVRSSSRCKQLLADGAEAVILRNAAAQDLRDALFQLTHDTIDHKG